MIVITISRQTGSLGEALAIALSKQLGIPLIDREYVHTHWLPEFTTMNQRNILMESIKYHLLSPKGSIPFYKAIENRLKDAASHQGAVIVGLGAQAIFQDWENALHIHVIAPNSIRLDRIQRQYGIDIDKAEKMMAISDRKHRRYLWEIYGLDWEDPGLYHLILNTSKLSIPGAVSIILQGLPEELALDKTKAVQEGDRPIADKVEFAHKSEEEFAKILDMYQIEWQYEPTTFPMEWDAEGNVTMAFAPDFYLPAFHTYIELTTMNQKYVTEKNKKVRRLKALFPEVSVTILYKKDIHALLKKFGIVQED